MSLFPGRCVAMTVLLLSMVLAAGPTGCSRHAQTTSDPVSSEAGAAGFAEWQIIEVASRKLVPFETLVDRLGGMDVVYLGEEHHNRHHIDAATRILGALVKRGMRPVLAIEMFGWDGQEALDRYVSGDVVDEPQFLRDVRWKANWPGIFPNYAPLLRFAHEHGLGAVAMNPPRSLVRRVSHEGLAQALQHPDMRTWGMQDETFADDPEYRRIIMPQLTGCHPPMKEVREEWLYEASIFRDEGMAKTVAGRLTRASEIRGPVVSYTGDGHIQYKLPVPKRVARRMNGSVHQTTIYMSALERDHPEYIEELLDERIADYIWLTPIGDHGPPVRCGR